MLKPSKFSNSNNTVLYVAYGILKQVKVRKTASFNDLYDNVIKKHPENKELFLYALSVLYIFGLIEYYPKNDLVVYVGK